MIQKKVMLFLFVFYHSGDLCFFRPRKYLHSAARFITIDLKLLGARQVFAR